MKRARAFLAIAVVIATVVALAPAVTQGQPAGDGAAPVRVDSGLVSGAVQSGVASYKGIPYAAPPVGALRWRPPAPAHTWSGVLRGFDYGASCPQPVAPERVPAESRARTTSEDCLTLNVWAPVPATSRLPVMVWLHGGGNVTGTGSQTYYDGSAFARDGVVLVTLNYRLGLLGFFAHRALSESSGNFGLLDQLAALRWVQKNIAAFGGDPANVTVFGESAGAEDAIALASSDASRGLFERAIAESTPDMWSDWATMSEAREKGAKIATSLGLPGARATEAQLRALPVDTIMHGRYSEWIGPMIDGSVVPMRPADGAGSHVALIIGTNDGEGSLVEDVRDPGSLFPNLAKPDLAAVLAAYRARGFPEADDVSRIFTAGAFAAPARSIAEQTVASGHPAFLYRFDYVLGALSIARHDAHHGSEIPFVFENYPPLPVSDADRAVGAAIHGCWVAFARTGAPSCPGAPGWGPYDARSGRVMVFDSTPSVRDPGNNDVLTLLQHGLLRH